MSYLSNIPLAEGITHGFKKFNKTILIVSRLSHEKNIYLVIRALARLGAAFSQTGLVIVGDGPQKQALVQAVKKYGLTDRVIFEGWQDNLATYFRSADLFVLSSDYEGWGLTVVEAMAAGCPVAMTDVGCAGELVINRQNGLISPVKDEIALSKTMAEILQDEKLAQDLKQRALQTISFLPGKEAYLADYKKLFEKTIDNYSRR